METSLGLKMAFPLLIAGLGVAALLVFVTVWLARKRPAAIGWVFGGFVVLVIAGLVFAPMFFGLRVDTVRSVGWLALLVVIGLVAAFVKGGRGVRTGIAVLALAVLLVVSALFFWQRAERHQMERATHLREASAIWHESLVDQYPADVYPSRRSAARALGIRLAAALEETEYHQEGAGTFRRRRVCFNRDPSSPGLMEIVAEGYGNCGGTWSLSPSAEHEVVVTLGVIDLQSGPAPWSAGTDKADRGTLQAHAEIKGGASIIVTADFVDKPWVENISAFLGRDPSRQFAFVRSQDCCTTREEARAQAIDEARNRILRQTARTRFGRRSTAMVFPESLIVDSFSQRLSGGLTGPMYREALLVDVSPERTEALVLQVAETHRSERLTWMRHAMKLAGMLALICVVYVFLNAATRGYYTWALRAAVVCAVGAVVLLFLLMS